MLAGDSDRSCFCLLARSPEYLRSGARDRGGGGDRLGQSAGAVRDGQGGGRRDGVGLAVVGQGGGLRAVGGQGSDDLSGVGHVLAGRDGSGKSQDGGDGELHFVGWG